MKRPVLWRVFMIALACTLLLLPLAWLLSIAMPRTILGERQGARLIPVLAPDVR